MPPSDFTEKRLKSRSVFRGRLLHVKKDEVLLPDGAAAVREYVSHPGAVVMIAFLTPQQILLERQFRYPLGRDFIELPAGKLEPDEDPLQCARRELLEETGYAAASWRHIATLHPCVGYSDERLEYFVARELTHHGSRPDDGEFLETLVLDLSQALAWVRDGRITDGKTVAGLLWAEKLASGAWPPHDGG